VLCQLFHTCLKYTDFSDRLVADSDENLSESDVSRMSKLSWYISLNMTNQESAIVFGREMAANYDKGNAVFAPIRDSLNFVIRAILAELPTDARILCVGVGTGSELINLAQAFPQWQFTAVEPAAAMLDICRQKVEACGMTSRCTFHEGYLDSLPGSDTFDAATCLFVSQFLLQSEKRSNFFHQIAMKLRSGGYLINADLAYDRSASSYPELLDTWLRIMASAGMPIEMVRARISAAYSRDVAVLPPSEVASIIDAGGFDSPVLFFQSLLMHAWSAKRSTTLQSRG
jgi:tRNA (cmo5U34)-methyltransferase